MLGPAKHPTRTPPAGTRRVARGGAGAARVLESPNMPVLQRVASALVGFLLLQEIAVRVVFPLPEVSNFDRGAYSHMGFTPDVEESTSLGHLSFRWASDPDGFAFVHALNLYGFRDVEWRRAKPAGGSAVRVPRSVGACRAIPR